MTLRAVLVGAALAAAFLIGGPANAATDTFTATVTSTATVSPTATRTATASRTATATATATRTATATQTATSTRTRTRTDTATITRTQTATSTQTKTASPSRTASATRTATVTVTASRTVSGTSTSTSTRTRSGTFTLSLTVTNTPVGGAGCDVPAQDSLCRLVNIQSTALAGGGVAAAPAYPPVVTSTPIYYTVVCDLTPVSLGTPDAGRISLRMVPDGGTTIGYAGTAALAISDGQPLTNLTGHTLERVDGCTGEIFVVSRDGTPVSVRAKVVRYP